MIYPNQGSVFIVERTSNGQLFTSFDIEDGKINVESMRKICGMDGADEYTSFQYFLYSILEDYGPSQSKHNPRRIYINVEPGHNTDGITEDEEYSIEGTLNMIREEGLDATIKFYTEVLEASKKFRKEHGY
jgi:hypothetical protein